MKRSIRTRLALSSAAWIIAGAVACGFALESVYRRHVTEHFELELLEHLEELASLTDLDKQGQLKLERPLSDLRFLPASSGFYWQVERAGGAVLRSESLAGADLGVARNPPQQSGLHREIAAGPTGRIILLRRRIDSGEETGPIYAGIAADQRYLDEILWDFRHNLALSLGVIAAGLIALAVLQIGLLMRPLNRMREAIGDVRSGRRDALPDDLPSEITPLVNELNNLMQVGRDALQRARSQAGNLAHGLKTPLAILMDEGNRLLAAGQTEAARTVLQQCERMRGQVERHLARTRAGARSGAIAAARLAPTLETIVQAVSRLHRDRRLSFDIVPGPSPDTVACDVEDLYEMLGCIIDNAAKWARTRVRIEVGGETGGTVRLRIEDDGPGMPVNAREKVFEQGERLDEQTPGSGLGLTIVRDLADAYGGRVWIEDAHLGGAAVCLELPAPAHGRSFA